MFNFNLEILFKLDEYIEKTKYKICYSKNNLIKQGNFKYKNEELLKLLKTTEIGIKILNFKVIKLFKIFIEKNWKSTIKKNFEIDEEKLEKIETTEKNENENYMNKYNKIVKEITEYEEISNNNEGINKDFEGINKDSYFRQILPINLFRTEEKKLKKIFEIAKMKKKI